MLHIRLNGVDKSWSLDISVGGSAWRVRILSDWQLSGEHEGLTRPKYPPGQPINNVDPSRRSGGDACNVAGWGFSEVLKAFTILDPR